MGHYPETLYRGLYSFQRNVSGNETGRLLTMMHTMHQILRQVGH